MNLPNRHHTLHFRGMTFLEITVVLCVLLALLCALFVGTSVWKRGSDRAACVLNIRNLQCAVRSYQNLGGYDTGAKLAPCEGSADILDVVHLKGFVSDELYDIAKGLHACPGGGYCSCAHTEAFPILGELFMTCSFQTDPPHQPITHDSW